MGVAHACGFSTTIMTQLLSKVQARSKRCYINSCNWLAVHCLASLHYQAHYYLISFDLVKMTYRTLLNKPVTTCVVCWPEEENKLSMVPAKKIVSPHPADLALDVQCKVQGLESHQCKIVAMGTVEEVVKKIRQLEAGEDSEDSEPPTGDATDPDPKEPPPQKKLGVKKAPKKQKPITTCVVCWPEEENKLSVVSCKKIISPATVDFAPDTFCKVKGFESHLCKIVAMGTEAEMKKKIRQLEADDDQEGASPKKKARVEKASKGRKWLGKENKNKPPSQQN